MIVKSIEEAVHNAARENKKIAVFHYQILINADELKGKAQLLTSIDRYRLK